MADGAEVRTILAVDELLAGSIKPKLAGSVSTIGHMTMRDLGDGIEDALRELVTARPSVLAIGGRAWDALPLLRRLNLPWAVPIILLTPELTTKRAAACAATHVLSVVPLDGSVSGVASAVSVEVELAKFYWAGVLKRPMRPVVVSRPRVSPPDRPRAPLVILDDHRRRRSGE